ncbi:hypothetical protein ACFFGV_13700 [Pontibacillus salicampi]|uniref:Uncharacterized protein n=1 Tax=Pontibacillus salicampi TaxID=1449801 RepID=A0ABV6LQE8_9BACI
MDLHEWERVVRLYNASLSMEHGSYHSYSIWREELLELIELAEVPSATMEPMQPPIHMRKRILSKVYETLDETARLE